MATRKRSSEEEISHDFRGDDYTGAGDDSLRRAKDDAQANPIVDYLLERPTSHMASNVASSVHEYLTAFRPNKDKLHCFIAAANATKYMGTGVIGTIETARLELLYEQVTDLRDASPIRGRAVRICAGIGALYPLTLFELQAGFLWLREQDDATYKRLVQDGMRGAGDLFDRSLHQAPHLLMASADIRGSITGDQLALARYVVNKHIKLGCSILLTVSDADMLHTGSYGQLTKGIKTFDLGRF